MAEKRYYWLKLYKDFFTSKRIKMLRSVAGGDTYTIIYLKMQLKALDTDGYLYFDGYMNDFAEELALDIDESVDNVKITIQFLMNVGLLESNAGETEYKLSFMENVVGSETASTQRSRESRARAKMLQCNKNATEVQRIGNAEKEIEIDKEKDKRFIKPSVKDIADYCNNNNYNIDAERFYDYYESKGWKVGKAPMKDWKAAVRMWSRNNKDQKPQSKVPDFTMPERYKNQRRQKDIEFDEIRKELGL